ncbi:hypothetical protein EDB86DRAFT_2225298 [Lactarius hatsudake]|nr:hypothetical protein EDB86DRAFT_2225298 [Lactarius hatsudake]
MLASSMMMMSMISVLSQSRSNEGRHVKSLLIGKIQKLYRFVYSFVMRSLDQRARYHGVPAAQMRHTRCRQPISLTLDDVRLSPRNQPRCLEAGADTTPGSASGNLRIPASPHVHAMRGGHVWPWNAIGLLKRDTQSERRWQAPNERIIAMHKRAPSPLTVNDPRISWRCSLPVRRSGASAHRA